MESSAIFCVGDFGAFSSDLFVATEGKIPRVMSYLSGTNPTGSHPRERTVITTKEVHPNSISEHQIEVRL